jgi:hypothetical protein
VRNSQAPSGFDAQRTCSCAQQSSHSAADWSGVGDDAPIFTGLWTGGALVSTATISTSFAEFVSRVLKQSLQRKQSVHCPRTRLEHIAMIAPIMQMIAKKTTMQITPAVCLEEPLGFWATSTHPATAHKRKCCFSRTQKIQTRCRTNAPRSPNNPHPPDPWVCFLPMPH